MHGEPDGGTIRVGPDDAVPLVRRNEQVISGAERARLVFALKQHPGRARKHAHPFVPILVVPEAVSARMPARDDALDADNGRGKDLVDLFLLQVGRDVSEEIGVGGHLNHDITPMKL